MANDGWVSPDKARRLEGLTGVDLNAIRARHAAADAESAWLFLPELPEDCELGAASFVASAWQDVRELLAEVTGLGYLLATQATDHRDQLAELEREIERLKARIAELEAERGS